MTGLDKTTATELLTTISNIAWNNEITVFMSIHNPDKEVFEIAHEIVFVLTGEGKAKTLKRCSMPSEDTLLKYKPKTIDVITQYPDPVDLPPMQIDEQLSFCQTYKLILTIAYRMLMATWFYMTLSVLVLISLILILIIYMCQFPRHWLVLYYAVFLMMFVMVGVLQSPISNMFAQLAIESKCMVIRRMKPLNKFAITTAHSTFITIYAGLITMCASIWIWVGFTFFLTPVKSSVHIVRAMMASIFCGIWLFVHPRMIYFWYTKGFEDHDTIFWYDTAILFMMSLFGGMTPPFNMLRNKGLVWISYLNPISYSFKFLIRALHDAYNGIYLDTDIKSMQYLQIDVFFTLLDVDMADSYSGGFIMMLAITIIVASLIYIGMLHAINTTLDSRKNNWTGTVNQSNNVNEQDADFIESRVNILV